MSKAIIKPIFSIGVYKKNCPDLLKLAKDLVVENTDKLVFDSFINHSTTLKGYMGRKDILNGESAAQFNMKLCEAANEYLEMLGYSKVRPRVEASWLTEMDSQGFHRQHMHYGMHISGCLYIEVPEFSNIIEFYNPFTNRPPLEIGNHNSFNSPAYVIKPTEGDILLWESTLFHAVPMLQFTGKRITIAFDIICERN